MCKVVNHFDFNLLQSDRAFLLNLYLDLLIELVRRGIHIEWFWFNFLTSLDFREHDAFDVARKASAQVVILRERCDALEHHIHKLHVQRRCQDLRQRFVLSNEFFSSGRVAKIGVIDLTKESVHELPQEHSDQRLPKSDCSQEDAS